jgi:hypothetical protein
MAFNQTEGTSTKLKKTKPHALSPRANQYWPSDRLLSAKLVPISAMEFATWAAWRIPMAVFSVF